MHSKDNLEAHIGRIQKRRPMARPQGWVMGCLLWIHSLIRSWLFSLCVMQIPCIFDREIVWAYSIYINETRLYNFGYMALEKFFTVILSWCNVWNFILKCFLHSKPGISLEPALSSLAPQVVIWQPLVAPVAAGLALWRLSAFSIPAPVQVLSYVSNEMFVNTP